MNTRFLLGKNGEIVDQLLVFDVDSGKRLQNAMERSTHFIAR